MRNIRGIRCAMGILLCAGVLCGCGRAGGAAVQTDAPPVQTTAAAETEAAVGEQYVTFAVRGESSPFGVIYDAHSDAAGKHAAKLMNAVKDMLGVSMSFRPDRLVRQAGTCEIVVGSSYREGCVTLGETLGQDEYAIRAVIEDGKQQILIAYKGEYALMCAIDRLIEEYVDAESGVARVPADLDVRGKFAERDALIVSSIPQLRDPCVLLVDGVYYAYGTGWVCWKNESGELARGWRSLGMVAQPPAHADTNYWAPEVHAYNGAYYMFTTYHSTETGHRGCTIMKADRPEGPFVEITNGHITPHDWDSIDGTLYIDEQDQPWMVFVHEWTSTDDGVGRMAAARLSDDLTHFISEPIELFRADDASWARGNVTDGCWMYRCADGQLLMLWSNWDSAGYCVGIARSSDGRIDGEWTHDRELLYSKNMTGQYDGGHGMLFRDADGQLYLSIHSPNDSAAGRRETPVFVPVREQNGTLIWDIWRDES